MMVTQPSSLGFHCYLPFQLFLHQLEAIHTLNTNCMRNSSATSIYDSSTPIRYSLLNLHASHKVLALLQSSEFARQQTNR